MWETKNDLRAKVITLRDILKDETELKCSLVNTIQRLHSEINQLKQDKQND